MKWRYFGRSVIQLGGLFFFLLLFISGAMAEASDNAGYEYYFKQLTPNEQAIYRVVLAAPTETAVYTVALPDDASSAGSHRDLVHHAVVTAVQDHPESMAWFAYFICEDDVYDIETNSVTFTLHCSEYYDSADQEMAENLIDAIVAKADPGWDLYTKAKFVSNVVIDALDYDNNVGFYYGGAQQYYNSNIYCVNDGYGICGGFSKLYKAIADRIGLPCVEVTSVGHAWVHVKMEDGNWYGIDPQSPDILRGTASMLGTFFMYGNDMYELYDGFFAEDGSIVQPERAVEDYDGSGDVTDPGSVDLTDIRVNTTAEKTTFLYAVNADGESCTITGFEGLETGDLTIPDSIDGYTVTAIGASAFAHACFDGVLTLPSSLETIENDAFLYCTGLSGRLVLPDSLKTIERFAFARCKGFTGEISFGKSLTSVGAFAFTYCEGISGSLMFPDGVSNLEGNAFFECDGLDGVIRIPDSITNWDSSCISCCDNLRGFSISGDHPAYRVYEGILYDRDMTTLLTCLTGYTGPVTIPEGVTTIADFAFSECKGVTALRLPSTLERVGASGCLIMTGITEPIVLPESLKYVGERGFSLNGGIRGTLVIRAGVEYGREAFSINQAIDRIVVEEGVTELPDMCFDSCSQTDEVYLPSTLQRIGDACFQFVQAVYYGYPGTVAEEYVNSEEGQNDLAKFRPLTNGIGLSEVEIMLSAIESEENHRIRLLIKPQAPESKIRWQSSDESVVTVTDGLVTGVSRGQATVTATIGDTVLSCHVTVSDYVQYSRDGKTLVSVSPNFTGHLIIPEGVETIGKEAIVGVEGLTGITFPSTLKTFSTWSIAHSGSKYFFDLILPEHGISIAENAFVGNYINYTRYPINAEISPCLFAVCRIRELEIPEGVASLPATMFERAKIDVCHLPSTLTNIHKNAFSDVESIGTFLVHAGTYAESYVKGLQAAYPDADYSYTAYGLLNYTAVTLEPGETLQLSFSQPLTEKITWTSDNVEVAMVDENGLVTTYAAGQAVIRAGTASGSSAECSLRVDSMAAAALPAQMKTVEAEAFMGTQISKVILPSGCTRIDTCAFACMPALVRVVIPDSVVSIAPDAFSRSPNVIIFAPEDSYAKTYAEDCGIPFVPR